MRFLKGAVVVCDSKGGCSRLSGRVEVCDVMLCDIVFRVVSIETGFFVCEQNNVMD